MSERKIDAVLEFTDGTVITLQLETVEEQIPPFYTYPGAHRNPTSGAESAATGFKLSGLTENNAARYIEV